ncbi:DUF2935 domain-containing protein [Halalkalibacter krulwichiae]|uniref:Uncharacterized protein n=1 Tax=Halalkalibacter krulwichiae TaxID=199441 RepID=A0A1X9M838_9BACI|nr:DUF2935 domain-containing protein [Halalkalibacter krulwichiae]ARK29605.1 hypothetical protein BkAM31D_06880 [Halalkalibacter krulwichiae]
MAQQYIDAFGHLRQKLIHFNKQEAVTSSRMMEFAKEVYQVAEGYYQFEGKMQSLRVQNQINLNLTPSYLNGTLSENEEYLRILTYYMNGENYSPLPLVDLLDLWLEDQLGLLFFFVIF